MTAITSNSFPVSPKEMLDKIAKADKDLDALLAKQPLILKLERQSGIKKTHMVYGLAAAIFFVLLFQVATGLVLSLVLFGYPLVMSLEAVESHDKAKDAHILSYWAVIATLQLTEVLLPFVKSHVPFYALLKLVLAVWMYLPQTKVSALTEKESKSTNAIVGFIACLRFGLQAGPVAS